MIIFKLTADLRKYLGQRRAEAKKIGFVPTMGALHEGHISLLEKAKQDGTLSVCSIFVNPAQFNNREDFEKYPSSIEADIQMLTEAGCDVLFLPQLNEIYPQGPENVRPYHFGSLETILEGEHRPGHFQGVGKVVSILLNAVTPDTLYMGSKDYQQCLIVKNLLSQMNLDQVELVICATKREADGLAMSSRNRRLTEPQRIVAATIYQCLVSLQSKFRLGSSFKIAQKECLDLLSAKGFNTEYVALADSDSLDILQEFDTSRNMTVLIAASIGSVRLIDNLQL